MEPEEWIYGVNPVLESIKAGRDVKIIYIASGRHDKVVHIRREAATRGIPVEVSDPSFFSGRFPKGHQGVAARAVRKAYISMDDLLAVPSSRNEVPLFVILDS